MGNSEGTASPPEPASTFNHGVQQGMHQGYVKGMSVGMKQGIAKGTTVGFKQGVAYGVQTKVASTACFAFLGGSLATLGVILAAGYFGKHSYKKSQDAEERERLAHFRDALDIACVESVVLDPDRMQTCHMENLLRSVEDLDESTLGELHEELHHILVMYPEKLRRWRVFQVNARRLMGEPINSPISRAFQTVAASGVDTYLIPLVLRNAELDDMVELQRKAIEEFKEKQKKLQTYAKEIDNRWKNADDVREMYQTLMSEIRFIELAGKALDDELAAAMSVSEDLARLQQLHDEFVNWILGYRAWKSSHDSHRFRTRQASFSVQSDHLSLEAHAVPRRSSTIELDITEPDGLIYDEPPPGYDTKLLLGTGDGSGLSNMGDETPSTIENEWLEEIVVVAV